MKRISGVLILVVAVVLFVAGFNNFLIRTLGLVLLMVALVVLGRVQLNIQPIFKTRLLWLGGIPSALAVLATFYALVVDAQNGYHQVWPVYGFSMAAIVATVIWATLAARMVKREW